MVNGFLINQYFTLPHMFRWTLADYSDRLKWTPVCHPFVTYLSHLVTSWILWTPVEFAGVWWSLLLESGGVWWINEEVKKKIMVRFHGLLWIQLFYHIILLMTNTQEFTIQVQYEDPKRKEKEKPLKQTLIKRFLKTVE